MTPVPKQTKNILWFLLITALLLSLTQHAHAGMPFNPLTFKLKESAGYRAEALSFFIVLTFVLALLLKWTWNALANDFPRLPKLTYLRSLGLVFLWGLFIAVIMSMTTAARAITTPGAWERAAASAQYQLTDPRQILLQKRRERLETLKTRLLEYASSHNGAFPANIYELNLPSDAFTSAHPNAAPLIYIPLRTQTHSPTPPSALLYEPDLFDDDRFCLMTDGSIHQFSNRQLIDAL